VHELALAEAVMSAALEAAEREGFSQIRSIEVRIGELQRIRPDVFEFALKQVLPASEPRLESTRITLEMERARLRCRACGREFGLADASGPVGHDAAEAIHFVPELAHSFLCCPDCASPDFEVRGGRGVSIESIEGQ
jgi:hydrogenase nickel incorporation protein HypA/HybF